MASVGGAIYSQGSGGATVSHSTLSGNTAETVYRCLPYGGSGTAIYTFGGTVTVENSDNVTGNTLNDLDEDVDKAGVLYLEGTSTIGTLDGNPPFRSSGPAVANCLARAAAWFGWFCKPFCEKQPGRLLQRPGRFRFARNRARFVVRGAGMVDIDQASARPGSQGGEA
jgi:hypothetical protein